MIFVAILCVWFVLLLQVGGRRPACDFCCYHWPVLEPQACGFCCFFSSRRCVGVIPSRLVTFLLFIPTRMLNESRGGKSLTEADHRAGVRR